MATNIVLTRMPQLKTLCLGGEQPAIFSDGIGNTNATWPWTGCVREYTFELWPEKESYSGEYAEYAKESTEYYGYVEDIEYF